MHSLYTEENTLGAVFLQHDRLRRTNVCSPLLISISVYDGHVAEGFRKLRPLASSDIERWYMAPGVKRVSVREKVVRGTLFIPPGECRRFLLCVCVCWC